MSILLFLLILSVLVFVHELGHFLFAKWCGIRVDTFAVGFPPTLWQKKVGETTYKCNALPLGGYVSIYGENYETLDPTDKDFTRSFAIKKWWQQMSVLLAGILFNVIFAFFILVIMGWIGSPIAVDDYNPTKSYSTNVSLSLGGVLPDSPAEEAGLTPGDSILEASSGATTLIQESLSIENLTQLIQESNEPITLIIKDRKHAERVEIVAEEGFGHNKTAGIGITMLYTSTAEPSGFFTSFVDGWKRLVGMTGAVIEGLSHLIVGTAHIEDLTGPVGLTGVVADASKQGVVAILFLTAFISINLAVINLLPFPALDGGRVVFVIIEAITGKRIPAKVGMWVNGVGFVLLMILMVVVTVQDVIKLF